METRPTGVPDSIVKACKDRPDVPCGRRVNLRESLCVKLLSPIITTVESTRGWGGMGGGMYIRLRLDDCRKRGLPLAMYVDILV